MSVERDVRAGAEDGELEKGGLECEREHVRVGGARRVEEGGKRGEGGKKLLLETRVDLCPRMSCG